MGRSPVAIARGVYIPATADANKACVVVVSVAVVATLRLSALLVQKWNIFAVVSRQIVAFTVAVQPAPCGTFIVAALKSWSPVLKVLAWSV